MSSTTTSKRSTPPPPKGNYYYGKKQRSGKAERRLKRDLADKEALVGLLDAFTGIIEELEHAAINNPIIGFAVGSLTIAIAHRFRLLSTTEYTLILAGFGLLEVSSAASNIASAIAGDIGAVAQFLPSVGAKQLTVKDQNSLIAGNATAVATSRGQPNTSSLGVGGEISGPKGAQY